MIFRVVFRARAPQVQKTAEFRRMTLRPARRAGIIV